MNNMHKKEIELYIPNGIEDFFNLPEGIQDRLINNTYFDYLSIWDRLDMEHKMTITTRYDFEYEKLWDKLGLVEKYNVIMYSNNFNWKKYTPYPNTEELNMLIYRDDYCDDIDDVFMNLTIEQKYNVTNKHKFNYKKFWDILDLNLKWNVILYNDDFEPLLYIDEMLLENDNNPTMKSLMDIYCKKNNISYDNIWEFLNPFQKMDCAIYSLSFIDIVGDKLEELSILFEKYPQYMEKFLINKVLTFNSNIFCFDNLDIYIKTLAIDIFKRFNIVKYDILENIVNCGYMTSTQMITLNIPIELCGFYPYCITKIDKNDILKNVNLSQGYYLFNISTRMFVNIIDYKYIFREHKLKRILNYL